MKIIRTSPKTGAVNTMDLDITVEQMDALNAGACIQDAFPQLTNAEREFIKTGLTEEDWNDIFKDEDDHMEAITPQPIDYIMTVGLNNMTAGEIFGLLQQFMKKPDMVELGEYLIEEGSRA